MTDYGKLAHVIMEAEKSHDLPSVSWRPRKADGVIQSKFKGLRMGRGREGVVLLISEALL